MYLLNKLSINLCQPNFPILMVMIFLQLIKFSSGKIKQVSLLGKRLTKFCHHLSLLLGCMLMLLILFYFWESDWKSIIFLLY